MKVLIEIFSRVFIKSDSHDKYDISPDIADKSGQVPIEYSFFLHFETILFNMGHSKEKIVSV